MMLGTTAEQDELRASVRRFLTDRAPLTRVRELMESEDGTDRGVWEQAGTQLGLQGLAVPEAYGGAGFSFAEQAIVLEEFGAALYGGPYLASAVLAATALLASPDEGARPRGLGLRQPYRVDLRLLILQLRELRLQIIELCLQAGLRLKRRASQVFPPLGEGLAGLVVPAIGLLLELVHLELDPLQLLRGGDQLVLGLLERLVLGAQPAQLGLDAGHVVQRFPGEVGSPGGSGLAACHRQSPPHRAPRRGNALAAVSGVDHRHRDLHGPVREQAALSDC